MATILLVDDIDTFRRVIGDILELHGYTVLEAENGVEALKLIEHQPAHIDLLLTDLLMPCMGGRELAERMVRVYPGLKIIYITGIMVSGKLPNLEMSPRCVLLKKPITSEVLLATVAELLAGSSQATERAEGRKQRTGG